MTTQNPSFYDSTLGVIRPMDTGALVPVSSIPVSATVGNRVSLLTDGLYYGDYYGSVYYVNTSGNDSNPGTKLSPFATIDHALAFVSSLFYGGRYAGSNITIALQAGQTFVMNNDFNLYPGSDITITFYGDTNYGDFNSAPVGSGANTWEMSDLNRPIISPASSAVSAQWHLAGINRYGGSLKLQGLSIQLPAAPSNPSIANYSGYVDFVRSVNYSNASGYVSLDGSIVNMTDTAAYWGFLGIHSRATVQYNHYGSQFQVNGILLSAANSPTTAQLGQRQYFIKFYYDTAGNNQQLIYLSTTTLNSSTASGSAIASWVDTEALTVATGKTNLATYPLCFDSGYGLTNYIYNLNRSSSGVPLNFMCSRLM